MNVRLEEAERDGLVGAENANEKEKGKCKIHKLQNTKYKVTGCGEEQKAEVEKVGGGGDIVIQMIDTMLKVEREKDGKIEKVEKAETWWQTNEMMVAKMHY